MLRTLSLFFLFALVPVQAAIYFAHNVSEDSGFINTKKYWNGDSDLCWAATASNMLQWWQNNSSGIPAFVPNGQNESGRTEIYDVFCNNWANTGKGSSEHRQIPAICIAGTWSESRITETPHALVDARFPVLNHFIHDLLHFLYLGRMPGRSFQFFKLRLFSVKDLVVINPDLFPQSRPISLGRVPAVGSNQAFRFFIQLRPLFFDSSAESVQFGPLGAGCESRTDRCGCTYGYNDFLQIDAHNCSFCL
mgnify:CR=1 FL=1